jgi:hypothetical protein
LGSARFPPWHGTNGKTSTPQGIPNTDGIDYSQRRAVVVVEGVTLATFVTGAITMLIIGILLNIVGLGIFCWALFALATHALPFFVLCGRPHKTNYVASHDMWRNRRSMLFFGESTERGAPHNGEATERAGKPSRPAGGTILQLPVVCFLSPASPAPVSSWQGPSRHRCLWYRATHVRAKHGSY